MKKQRFLLPVIILAVCIVLHLIFPALKGNGLFCVPVVFALTILFRLPRIVPLVALAVTAVATVLANSACLPPERYVTVEAIEKKGKKAGLALAFAEAVRPYGSLVSPWLGGISGSQKGYSSVVVSAEEVQFSFIPPPLQGEFLKPQGLVPVLSAQPLVVGDPKDIATQQFVAFLAEVVFLLHSDQPGSTAWDQAATRLREVWSLKAGWKNKEHLIRAMEIGTYVQLLNLLAAPEHSQPLEECLTENLDRIERRLEDYNSPELEATYYNNKAVLVAYQAKMQRNKRLQVIVRRLVRKAAFRSVAAHKISPPTMDSPLFAVYDNAARFRLALRKKKKK